MLSKFSRKYTHKVFNKSAQSVTIRCQDVKLVTTDVDQF